MQGEEKKEGKERWEKRKQKNEKIKIKKNNNNNKKRKEGDYRSRRRIPRQTPILTHLFDFID